MLGRLVDGEPLTGRWAGGDRARRAPACCCSSLGGGGASVDPLGVLLAVVSGTGYATYTVLAKRLLRLGHAPERVMAAAFSLGAVLLAPVLRARRRALARPPATGSRWRCSSARSPPRSAYVLFARGLRHLTPGETATLTLAEPLTATGLGVLVLGERPAPSRPAGAGARARRACSSLAAAAGAARAPAARGGAGMSARLALQRVSTVDAIAAALRTRILDGELGAGERLRELELAEAYGVARHSLRAALRALAAEGLVAIEPNRGARVARSTAADLGALFELRTGARAGGRAARARAPRRPAARSRSTTRCG